MSWWHIDVTHDPSRTSWIDSANGHPDFPVQNLPFGVFSPGNAAPRIGVAIGDAIFDLNACASAALVPHSVDDLCQDPDLTRLMAAPAGARQALRRRLFDLLANASARGLVEDMLHDAAACTMQLPMRIGDYTDFYAGIHHATTVGRIFRPDAPLLPNYKHVPIGYHGRSSSIRPSGVSVVRPSGQRKGPGDDAPHFGPTARLDHEVELGIWIGHGIPLGQSIPVGRAADHVAGLCLLNDWSARDVQAWEYQPLGPFLAKSFHTSISPWVVTTEALAPFRRAQPARGEGDPAPLAYLDDTDDQDHGAFAITLEAFLTTARMRAENSARHRLSSAEATAMYWTAQQLVAHHASNGCNLDTGDLLGTGTISGPTREGAGSFLELTTNGAEPLLLPNGERRTFLEDGDELLLRATASAPGFVPIGFGDCRAVILPAL